MIKLWYTTQYNIWSNDNNHFVSNSQFVKPELRDFLNSFVELPSDKYKYTGNETEFTFRTSDFTLAYNLSTIRMDLENGKKRYYDFTRRNLLSDTLIELRLTLNYNLTYFQDIAFLGATKFFITRSAIDKLEAINSNLVYKYIANNPVNIENNYISDFKDYRYDSVLSTGFHQSATYFTIATNGTVGYKPVFLPNGQIDPKNYTKTNITTYYGFLQVKNNPSSIYLVPIPDTQLSLAQKLECFYKIIKCPFLITGNATLTTASGTEDISLMQIILQNDIVGTISNQEYDRLKNGEYKVGATPVTRVFVGFPLSTNPFTLGRNVQDVPFGEVKYLKDGDFKVRRLVGENDPLTLTTKPAIEPYPNKITIDSTLISNVYSEVEIKSSQNSALIPQTINSHFIKEATTNNDKIYIFGQPVALNYLYDQYFYATCNGIDIFPTSYNIVGATDYPEVLTFPFYENVTLTTDKFLSNKLQYEALHDTNNADNAFGLVGQILGIGIGAVASVALPSLAPALIGGSAMGALGIGSKINQIRREAINYDAIQKTPYSVSSYPNFYTGVRYVTKTIKPSMLAQFNYQLFVLGVEKYTFDTLNNIQKGKYYSPVTIEPNQANKIAFMNIASLNVDNDEAIEWLWNKFTDGVLLWKRTDGTTTFSKIESFEWE